MSKKKNDVFFMEIFNDILKINKQEITIVYDKYNNIWFCLRDILIVLKYTSLDKTISQIKISPDNINFYEKIHPFPRGKGTIKPHKKFINESGLYELLSISTKPLARIFMDKYFTDIMPKIRKTGKFILNNEDKKELDKVNKKLNSVKLSNKSLINNQRNVVYPIGNSIYIIIKVINNKKYYKVGYTKNLNKRLNTYNTGEPNKIMFNYFIMVKNKDVDKCIKDIMKSEEFIKNKEYYMTTLTKILNFINKCDVSLNKINCGYCLKSFNLYDIKKHKCKYL